MSEMEYHTGKLYPRYLEGCSVEEYAEGIARSHGWDKDEEFYSTWTDVIYHRGCGNYLIVDEQVYSIYDEEIDTVSAGTLAPDGSIEYTAVFYNGRAGLDEVLEDIVRKVTK